MKKYGGIIMLSGLSVKQDFKQYVITVYPYHTISRKVRKRVINHVAYCIDTREHINLWRDMWGILSDYSDEEKDVWQ